jgi:ribosomal 50S subunit-associated protein YjgA (DUF615 family)
MALKRNKNGQFIISSQAEAKRALEMLERLQSEIAELEKEHGIDEMKIDSVELKKAATNYLAAKGAESLKFGTGRIAKLVRAVNQKKWIGTKDELTQSDYGQEVKPLRSLVNKETWMLITKRVPDPEKIDQMVVEGDLKLKDIEAAYVETYKAPYLYLGDDK